MSVQYALDDQNFEALELFTDGRFSEAAQMFTTPEYRCAALLNAGDRAGLIAEPASYDQQLFLAVARGWSTGRLLRKIAQEGLCKPPHSLARWIEPTIKTRGRMLPRWIAENLIVPATADRGGASNFVLDKIEIDSRILARDFDTARGLLHAARERWGERPQTLLAEARILRETDRPRALPAAVELARAFPDYAQGLTLAIEEAVNHATSNSPVPGLLLEPLLIACETGIRSDPIDTLFWTGRGILRSIANYPAPRALLDLCVSVPYARIRVSLADGRALRSIRRLRSAGDS